MKSPDREAQARDDTRLPSGEATSQPVERHDGQYATEQTDDPAGDFAVDERRGQADQVEVQRPVLACPVAEGRDQMRIRHPALSHFGSRDGVPVEIFVERQEDQARQRDHGHHAGGHYPGAWLAGRGVQGLHAPGSRDEQLFEERHGVSIGHARQEVLRRDIHAFLGHGRRIQILLRLGMKGLPDAAEHT